MSFKIYTYADPYRIHETDFWDEIKHYPHLCASRTLVRGLMSVLPDEEILTLFCPLDSIVKDRIFADWSNNISRRIQQYSELGRQYKILHEERNADWNISDLRYEAINHNKNSMLDSLRLFIELGINADTLDTSRLNFEHRLFAYLLKFAERSDLFALPKLPAKHDLHKYFCDQAEAEKKEKADNLNARNPRPDEKEYKKELAPFERMIEKMRFWDGDHVVIHGVHQFTPLQLRLLTYLDKLGIEVIFLYNYLPQYKEIYSSWNYIYQQFDAPIHHDTKITTYHPDMQFKRAGVSIAENMALLCEDNISRNDPRIIRNYQDYKDERVVGFENISEYAGYVSDLFAEAEAEIRENTEVESQGQPQMKQRSTSEVLAKMEDVIYTANKDVDELLQVYHPEYARNRHFLAYPIGQFFVALYGLWNVETGEIDIDYGQLRACVNSGILTGFNTPRLLKTLMNVEPLFLHVDKFSTLDELFQKYIKEYAQVTGAGTVATSPAYPFRALTLYSTYKVPQKDIEELHTALRQINSIAKDLFGTATADEQFQFGNHFRRLRDFVDSRQTELANEEEKDLIGRLLDRLDNVQKQLAYEDRAGTLDDLRAGLYFFLKQKEEPVPDWFVRNFEQIDGDVLMSRRQTGPGKRKRVYHFACVSDKDMNQTVDELLPWPLSEMFIERAYNPKELPFQVYYAALGERSNFLRYALFYGLYFSQCDTKISFVRRYGDNATDYYELLRLIGLKEEDSSIHRVSNDPYSHTTVRAQKVTGFKYDREQMAAMFLCPYRYLLDYVLNKAPVLSGSFLMQRFFVNVLIENTWRTMQGKEQKDMAARLTQIVTSESSKIERYCPFFIPSEVIDMRRQAENYVLAQVFKDGYLKVRPLETTHMALRKTFGTAEFLEDLQDLPRKHHYPDFEQLATIKQDKKSYSVHSTKNENSTLIGCVLNYLNETDSNYERAGSWCAFCPDNGICLAAYEEKR